MKISIITVCRNSRKEIENTILSIYNQTHEDIEHIVIDGVSTDGTLEILEKYKDKISYFISEPDLGIYNAMNKGLKHITGDIVYFLNAGDSLYSTDVLEKIVDNFKKTNASIVIGDVFFTNNNNFPEVDLNHKPNQIHSYETIKHELDFEGPCHQVIFYKKEVFDKVSNYNENYKIYADYEFNIRAFVLNKMPLSYIKLTVANFDLGGCSTKYSDAQSKECMLIRENTGYNKLIYRNPKLKKFMNKYFKSILRLFEKMSKPKITSLLNFIEE